MVKVKRGKNTENNFHIPKECIMEILLRLPVRSLIRFKCVAKTWLSLISDHKFAKSHFELSARPSDRLIFHQGDEFHSIDPDVLFHGDPPIVKLVPPPFASSYAWMSSCEGVILLNDYPDFVLWNPSTGVMMCVPSHHLPPAAQCYNHYIYGLGYDASKDDYLIVLASQDQRDHCNIFSVRANSWIKFENTVPSPFIDGRAISEHNKTGLFLNGALHWKTGTGSHDCILSFDLIERSFSEINLPETTEENGSSIFQVMGGYLTVTYIKEDRTVEVWMMKEYKVQSSWIRYDLDRENFIEPIYLAKSGDIIGIDDDFAIVKYNARGELLDRRPHFRYWQHNILTHAESIMTFPSDSGEAGNGNQQ